MLPELWATAQECRPYRPCAGRCISQLCAFTSSYQHDNYVALCATCSGYLNVPVAEYKSNLEAMIDKLKDKGVENVLVLLPPPVRGSTAQSRAEVVSTPQLISLHGNHSLPGSQPGSQGRQAGS